MGFNSFGPGILGKQLARQRPLASQPSRVAATPSTDFPNPPSRFPYRSVPPPSKHRVHSASIPTESLISGPAAPIFSSFGALFKHFTGITPPPSVTIPWSHAWRLKAPDFEGDDDDEVETPATASSSLTRPLVPAPRRFSNLSEYAAACLRGPQPPLPIKHVFWRENPTQSPPSSLPQAGMAFRLVDPTPFMPPGAQRMVVNGRPTMRRVVTGHIAEQNNDLAIANFLPAPHGPTTFMAIRDAIQGFLTQRNITFVSIQPYPFGQAYVRFSFIFERDMLIQAEPQPLGNGTSIYFTAYNRAWNNRTTVMSHDVWIMLLGLNIDLWTQPLLEKAISSFGLLLVWEEDWYHLARAVVRVRVSSLKDIPWFFVFTEGHNFESNSWCVQCEILQANMLGGAPQDEDFPPHDDNFNPNAFHF